MYVHTNHYCLVRHMLDSKASHALCFLPSNLRSIGPQPAAPQRVGQTHAVGAVNKFSSAPLS